MPLRDRGHRRLRHAKYRPLAAALAAQASDCVQFTFVDIEALLGTGLPPSARRLRYWWGSRRLPSPQIRAWRNAGWRVADVDLDAEQVTFVRHPPRTIVRGQKTL